MTQKTQSKKSRLSYLTEQLRQFGLNPRDWRVIPIQKGSSSTWARLTHRTEPGFALVGEWKQAQEGFQWASLKLSSF